MCGRLTWAWDEAELPHLRIGALMIEGLVWRDGAWRDGRLLNPEDGHTYRGAIRAEGDLLRLRGCAGPFCQQQTWRRLSSIPRPAAP